MQFVPANVRIFDWVYIYSGWDRSRLGRSISTQMVLFLSNAGFIYNGTYSAPFNPNNVFRIFSSIELLFTTLYFCSWRFTTNNMRKLSSPWKFVGRLYHRFSHLRDNYYLRIPPIHGMLLLPFLPAFGYAQNLIHQLSYYFFTINYNYYFIKFSYFIYQLIWVGRAAQLAIQNGEKTAKDLKDKLFWNQRSKIRFRKYFLGSPTETLLS